MARIVQVYKGEDGWRWRKLSGDDIVADSGEGYEHKQHALEMAHKEAGEGDEVVVFGAEEDTA